jgi:tetratricopeptide (TPR) repeat protein
MKRIVVWVTLSLVLFTLGCGKDAAKRAEEQRLREEIAARERREKLDTLVAKAKDEMKAERPGEAVKALDEALKIQEDAPARELLGQARKAAYDKAMTAGREAMKKHDYAAATTAFRDAVAQMPDDKEAKSDLEEVEFAGAVVRGREALQAQRFEEATKAFQEALGRRPADKECQDLLTQAKTGWRRRLVEDGRTALAGGRNEEAVKALTAANDLTRDDEVTALLTDAKFRLNKQRGQQQLQEKNYAAAVASFGEAVALKPADPEAGELLNRAKELLAAQIEAEYQAAVAEGDAAMQVKDFPRAIAAYNRALTKKPKDPLAADKLAGAQLKQDKLDYERAMTEGEGALGRKDYAGAVRAFERALQKKPRDAAATAKLAVAQSAKAKKESYDRHIDQGKRHVATRNYDLAIVEFQLASADMPGELEAARLVEQARTLKTKKASYDRHMSAGNSALAGKQYANAEAEFQRALDDIANDADATRLLQQARTLKAKKESYDRHMSSGKSFLSAKNFRSAEREFSAALMDIPGDAEASRLLQEAKKGK